MPRQSLVLNGKNVFLSEPYTPDYRWGHGLVGRVHELRMATAAWIAQPGLPALSPTDSSVEAVPKDFPDCEAFEHPSEYFVSPWDWGREHRSYSQAHTWEP